MAKKFDRSKVNKKALIVIDDYLQNLNSQLKISQVILFGSAARGEINSNSDIDLVVISPDFKGMEFFDRLLLLTRLRRGMRITAPMDILGYTKREFDRFRKESAVLDEAWNEGMIIK